MIANFHNGGVTPEELNSVERVVADHLEEKCISLNDALIELNLNEKLAEDIAFCMELDFHILCCVDCGYWCLPCLMTENAKGEEVCENCLDNN